LCDIVDNYKVLHFDEEPILFMGTNEYGNKIIGSFVEDDEKAQLVRYFHIILKDRQYNDFLHQKISYQELFRTNDEIFVIDKDYSGATSKKYVLNFGNIPKRYLPSEDSFCPLPEHCNDLNFTLALKGKLADINQAVPRCVGRIQSKFSDMLNNILKSLKGFGLIPSVYLLPYESGSFRLNFSVELGTKHNDEIDLFSADAAMSKYLNNFLQYSLEHLPDDIEDIIDNDGKASKCFTELSNTYKEVYASAQRVVPNDADKRVAHELKQVADDIEDLSMEIGDSFEDIQVLKSGDGDIPIGYIDFEYRDKINSTVQLIEKKSNDIVVDSEPSEYRISIYHLNVLTRTGNAIIYNTDSMDKMSKPKIKILGDMSLEESIFTESLHMNKWIEVRATATKEGDKYKKLEIIS
jgi:hypothetical protein